MRNFRAEESTFSFAHLSWRRCSESLTMRERSILSSGSFPACMNMSEQQRTLDLETSQTIPTHGPRLAGVQGSWFRDCAVTGAGGAGGVDHGTFVKSKNSRRLGCAASRGVKCAEAPMKRFSTNLITAVWSIGVCET